MITKRKLELLSPAKNSETAFAAIRNGADAVYIGGPGFGARKAAGNSLEEINRVVEYAHRFYCRVFVTINTILYDRELKEAESLIRELYRMEVDAVIIQDPAMLKLDLPPIVLHASTQMHNYEPERIRFLDELGFQRIILARELSLEQIREIRAAVKAELEFFVHGALCVSLSGQCYLSHYATNRSANRGECIQACRLPWTLSDADGKVLLKDRHLLSLKDLNLSAALPELIEAGIDSFKIEGRLKDQSYVANVTNYYSGLLDRVIAKNDGMERASSGKVFSDILPDPERSFNRGASTYFLREREEGMVNMDTPKSMGKEVGRVLKSQKNQLWVEAREALHNGDGLCYIESGELKGIRINNVFEDRIICNENVSILPGTLLYRNHDHLFVTALEKSKTERKIRLDIGLYSENNRLVADITDEDGVAVSIRSEELFEPAVNKEQSERICQQFRKTGDTDFHCESVNWKGGEVLFIPLARINYYRRELLNRLSVKRHEFRERWVQQPFNTEVVYPGKGDWRLNVVNHLSAGFYKEHGLEQLESGFELQKEFGNKALMRSRYCLLFEMGQCLRNRENKIKLKLPLFISNELGRFRLSFDCEKCFMEVRNLETACIPPKNM